ncbi:hypothetical protein EBR37_00925 [bacterium]|jgi:hypothetical protein|nr:hypothetical protein [bacterium]
MSKEQDYLSFQVRRKVTSLFKNYFIILEDLVRENPSISQEKYNQIRKRILDYSNDTIREIEQDIEQFKISL